MKKLMVATLFSFLLPLYAMEEGYSADSKREEFNDADNAWIEKLASLGNVSSEKEEETSVGTFIKSIFEESKQEGKEIESETTNLDSHALIAHLDAVCKLLDTIKPYEKRGVCDTLLFITSNMVDTCTFDVPQLNTIRNMLRSAKHKNKWQTLITKSFMIERSEKFLFSDDVRQYVAEYLLSDHNLDESSELFFHELYQLYKDDELIKNVLPPLEDDKK